MPLRHGGGNPIASDLQVTISYNNEPGVEDEIVRVLKLASISEIMYVFDDNQAQIICMIRSWREKDITVLDERLRAVAGVAGVRCQPVFLKASN